MQFLCLIDTFCPLALKVGKISGTAVFTKKPDQKNLRHNKLLRVRGNSQGILRSEYLPDMVERGSPSYPRLLLVFFRLEFFVSGGGISLGSFYLFETPQAMRT